jgi:CopG family nickel-responsive transcriptional regulator
MLQHRNVRRFSISLPPSLVDEFDETWQRMKYDNRSKAVHDAVRGFISEAQWMSRESDIMVGVILVLYYLDKPGLVSEIAVLQHRFKKVISSIQQLFIEENKFLEILSVKGESDEIKQLTQELMVKKGVKHVKVSIIAP